MKWGSGYQRINNACRSSGYPEPEWQELDAAVRVVFKPHPELAQGEEANETVNDTVNDTVNERQKWFLKQLASGAKTKYTDLAQHWNVSFVTAKRDIADLKGRGDIEFTGPPKTGFYRRK